MTDREDWDDLPAPERNKLDRDDRVRQIIAEIRARLRGEAA